MIFVTLGTQDKSFSRLLDAIQKQIDNGNIKEKVVVQVGYTQFKSSDMEIFDYISKEDFEEFMKTCDILITHGGVGSIMSGLEAGKKIIAAARLKKYGEHTNDHQIQIIEKFEKEGYLLALNDFDNLDNIIKKVKKMKVKKYKSNTKNIINYLENYIDNVFKEKK